MDYFWNKSGDFGFRPTGTGKDFLLRDKDLGNISFLCFSNQTVGRLKAKRRGDIFWNQVCFMSRSSFLWLS